MSTIFDGHTIFIWQVKNCTAGIPAHTEEARYHLVNGLQVVGLRTAIIKVADGAGQYNLRPDGRVWRDDILPSLFDRLRSDGRPRIGWHYLYGRSPIDEAERAAERIETLGLDGYVLDPEVEYKKAGPVAARQFMRRLRQLCPRTPLALCSYRYPSEHRDFPWQAFLDEMDAGRGDVHMPQVYWMGDYSQNAGDRQLRESYAQLTALERLPVIPVGPAWGQYIPTKIRPFKKWWEPTAEQMQKFALEAWNLKCPGLSWWDWDKLQEQDAVRPGWTGPKGWWGVLNWTSEHWPGEAPPPPKPPGRCPTCDEEIEDAWNYCAWCGGLLRRKGDA